MLMLNFPSIHNFLEVERDLMLGWSLNFFCDVKRDLLRSFIVNKECRFLCHFFDMFNTKPTQQLKLRTFSIDKVTAAKKSSLKSIGIFSNFVVFISIHWK